MQYRQKSLDHIKNLSLIGHQRNTLRIWVNHHAHVVLKRGDDFAYVLLGAFFECREIGEFMFIMISVEDDIFHPDIIQYVWKDISR